MTTVSMESETERDPEARLQDFREEDERCVYRSENTEFRRGRNTAAVLRTNIISGCWSGVGAKRLWTLWWRSAWPRSSSTRKLKTGEKKTVARCKWFNCNSHEVVV